MSEQPCIALVGASGLVGQAIIRESVGRADYRLLALARSEVALPHGATMDVVIADPADWGRALGHFRPHVLMCALGTTMRKVGGDKQAFRAVDHDLIVNTAQAALANGVERCVVVSAVGADPAAKNFYLQVKGETEQALLEMDFQRLDLLRPGLLRGTREGDRRVLERAAIIFSPVTNLLLHGKHRRLRAIAADYVARAALSLARTRTPGKFYHEYDAIRAAADELPQLADGAGEC